MPVRTRIDMSLYARMFPLDVPTTIALVIRLMGIVPRSKKPQDKDELARIRPAAATLRESTLHLKSTWKVREESGVTKLRPLDIEWDAAWSALLARLEPWSIFAHVSAHAEDASRAAELIALLFAKRLEFTQLELNAQWVEGAKRLSWIDEKNLRPQLARLAGEPFVVRIEETHQSLGRALGLLGEAPDPDLPLVVDLVGAKRAVHDAITDYALQLVAADRTATDELSDQIRSSLATIDAFRPRIHRDAGSDDAGSHDAGAGDAGADTGDTDPTTVDVNTPIPPLPTE